MRTKPQLLAGVHRGSRVFSLTGLEVDEIREVVVHAEMEGGIYVLPRQEKRELVRAGQTYEIRFDELAELEEVHPADAFEMEDPSIDLTEVYEAVRRAEEAASRAEAAKNAAENAQSRVLNVEERVTQLIAEARQDLQRHVEQVAETAAHVASQAARSNEEAFKLETGDKPLIAYVQYKSDGSLAQMMFEAPTTPTALNFKETTGVHRDVQNVEVRVRFTLKIQIPDPENEGKFKDVSEVVLPSESVVSFSDGIGTLDFFDRAMPEQHLSAQFKAALFEKWARSHEKGRVHVLVHAIRPNGTAVEVEVTGQPIILSLRNP